MIPSLNRILIIEDDEIYRFELSDFLEQAGYEVFQATTGKNANEDIDLHKINLLILDLSLPGLNGFEIAREVKAVYSTVGIVFKGSGFYKTDSATKPAASSSE